MSSETDTKYSPTVTPDELWARYKAGEELQLVDVRTEEEYALVRLPNTQHIPQMELSQRLEEIDFQREVIFICRSGNRTTLVTQALRQSGLKTARHLFGGLINWPGRVEGSAADGDWRSLLEEQIEYDFFVPRSQSQ